MKLIDLAIGTLYTCWGFLYLIFYYTNVPMQNMDLSLLFWGITIAGLRFILLFFNELYKQKVKELE